MKEKKCAEAIVKLITKDSQKIISKKRVPKNYRSKELDNSIRKKRTRSESKILKKLNGLVNVPEIYLVDEKNFEIQMEFIDGLNLKEIIEKKPELAKLAGEEIKKIHAAGIIHGDLTTSNIIYYNKKLYFIDFGLGYFSDKIEDKATDLIVFKKTFNATHSKLKNGWSLVIKGYNPNKELIDQVEKIKKRARYH